MVLLTENMDGVYELLTQTPNSYPSAWNLLF